MQTRLPRWRLMLVGLPLLLLQLGFTPFTPVTSVCPTCAVMADEITLTSGTRVFCRVVAMNDDYYVVSSHGELRLVQKSEITSLKWKDKHGAVNVAIGDQVLLKDGSVRHGAIVEEQQGRYLVMQVGAMKHILWYTQIQSVHRAGKLQPPSGGPTTPPAGP